MIFNSNICLIIIIFNNNKYSILHWFSSFRYKKVQNLFNTDPDLSDGSFSEDEADVSMIITSVLLGTTT